MEWFMRLFKKQSPAEVTVRKNPLTLSTRFLAARPDLVGVWFAGVHGILSIYKRKHRETVLDFFEIAEHEFFVALRANFEKKHPDQTLAHTFGSICRNRRRDERLVVGIEPDESGKPKYHYVETGGTVGACNEATMITWMKK